MVSGVGSVVKTAGEVGSGAYRLSARVAVRPSLVVGWTWYRQSMIGDYSLTACGGYGAIVTIVVHRRFAATVFNKLFNNRSS